jgi:hypothetical protein
MSWLSDGLDWIGSQFGGGSYQTPGTFEGNLPGMGGSGSSSGGSWIDRNWGTISKIADGGRKLYNMFDINDARKDSRNQLLDVYAKMEAENNAYNQQMAQYNAQRSAGAAAARRANDAKARKAQAKAIKLQEKMMKQMISNYQPYADAAKMLTPEMANNYKQFLDTTSLFNQYLTPTVAKTLGSAPTPMAAPQVNPQAYTAPSQAPQVSFPTIDEMLKRGK